MPPNDETRYVLSRPRAQPDSASGRPHAGSMRRVVVLNAHPGPHACVASSNGVSLWPQRGPKSLP